MPGGGLAAALIARPPRETSGASSANRFEYQRTWTLCHLLKLHSQPSDYVLVLEFHDDVLVLDSSTDPAGVDFFQVKTRKDGKWSKRELLSVPKAPKATKASKPKGQGPPPATPPPPPKSILGKLLEHVRDLGNHVRAMTIVSNARYDLRVEVPPECVDRNQICLAELEASVVTEIQGALQTELGLGAPPMLDRAHLLVSDLSLNDHATHGEGALSRFLHDRKPDGRFAVHTLFRTISDELTRRATNEWKPASFGDLCRGKGISRAEFESMLRQGSGGPFDPDHVRASLKAQLQQENESYRSIGAFERAWALYELHRMDPSNQIIQAVRERAAQVGQWLVQATTWATLVECRDCGVAEYLRQFGALESPLDDAYVGAAILWEMKNHEARQLPTPGPQPAAKAP